MNIRSAIQAVVAERAKQALVHSGSPPDVVERLEKLIEWHADNARWPVDVAGSDRVRASKKRFHEAAAADIRVALAAVKQRRLRRAVRRKLRGDR